MFQSEKGINGLMVLFNLMEENILSQLSINKDEKNENGNMQCLEFD